MVSLVFFLSFSLFSGCAKLEYLIDQGAGQWRLMSDGRNNEDVLKDKNISKKHKEKILKIESYKTHFYKFWNREATSIYTQTTFLKQKAVTYLVIASPHSEIKAKEECFPMMGCFPYIGFFSEKKAQEHAKKLAKKDWETYLRPVYAYSTLGYLEDNILSSFFYFDDYELAELIFHELFHTIFFINGEVTLNENLANYFGKEMALTYFKVDEITQRKRELENDKRDEISRTLVKLAQELNKQYKEKELKNKDESLKLRKDYFKERFIPVLKKTCEKVGAKNCFALKRKWNNASLAAFLTYEEKGKKIENLREKLGLNLKDFYFYIEKKYLEYRQDRRKKRFSEVLFQ